ncbi:MAG TPA: dephospho-CoA kinase [Chitinophagaceae bacterium]|nr:dephospho-CoA kinase [Chitinophagaceae bacterium]MCC6635869.1 dephospho-CoA kinase [Chitinophagaceae bacterium]HMZ46792.1 dephospho-CoA kinase [Chitinophagaceae bacterium]HNM34694.1 dephospho-CoA kinase [Chitinophagaceae bacterium]HNN32095.1 dephospho-CoA kinase [Chitinophagaceae bacterium]
MIKVGITGGIGSGKSIVSNIFKILNIPVFDADFEAKKIMTESVVVKQQLIATFGNAVFLNNELNRQYLSTIVFSDAHLLEKLNAIVHPAIIDAGNEWANQQISPYVIKEAALLFEAGSASDLDYVIGVYAPKIIRLQRVMQRDKVDKQAVLNRMSKQIDEEIKMKLCDFIITNDDEQMVIPQVLKLHEKFLAMSNM